MLDHFGKLFFPKKKSSKTRFFHMATSCYLTRIFRTSFCTCWWCVSKYIPFHYSTIYSRKLFPSLLGKNFQHLFRFHLNNFRNSKNENFLPPSHFIIFCCFPRYVLLPKICSRTFAPSEEQPKAFHFISNFYRNFFFVYHLGANNYTSSLHKNLSWSETFSFCKCFSEPRSTRQELLFLIESWKCS